jgi:hypothetical protein
MRCRTCAGGGTSPTCTPTTGPAASSPINALDVTGFLSCGAKIGIGALLTLGAIAEITAFGIGAIPSEGLDLIAGAAAAQETAGVLATGVGFLGNATSTC